jgi:hypothetical protein
MKNKNAYSAIVAVSVALSGWSVGAEVVKRSTTTTTTISGGTISEFVPSEAVVLQTEPNAAPVRYAVTRQTTYVDETGTPVTKIERGLPVTVQYVQQGNRLVASRVIVHREPKMTKARAKVLRDYYDKLENTARGEERIRAKALKAYYDELEEGLSD